MTCCIWKFYDQFTYLKRKTKLYVELGHCANCRILAFRGYSQLLRKAKKYFFAPFMILTRAGATLGDFLGGTSSAYEQIKEDDKDCHSCESEKGA